MSINELKLHEKGILNLFESQQAVAKMISHNKPSGNEHAFVGHNMSDPNIFEAKLSQQEYDSIFDNPPTF